MVPMSWFSLGRWICFQCPATWEAYDLYNGLCFFSAVRCSQQNFSYNFYVGEYPHSVCKWNNFYRYCWLLIWLWIAKTHKEICGLEYAGMSTWPMLSRSAITVSRRSYTLWSMEREDFGVTSYPWQTRVYLVFLVAYSLFDVVLALKWSMFMFSLMVGLKEYIERSTIA